MNVFPDHHELMSLFESEPTLVDAETPWTYNRLQFTRTTGDSAVECIIEPGCETPRFRWSLRGTEVMDLRWVSGLTVE